MYRMYIHIDQIHQMHPDALSPVAGDTEQPVAERTRWGDVRGASLVWYVDG